MLQRQNIWYVKINSLITWNIWIAISFSCRICWQFFEDTLIYQRTTCRAQWNEKKKSAILVSEFQNNRNARQTHQYSIRYKKILFQWNSFCSKEFSISFRFEFNLTSSFELVSNKIQLLITWFWNFYC